MAIDNVRSFQKERRTTNLQTMKNTPKLEIQNFVT